MKILCTWMYIVGLLTVGASVSLAASPGECLNEDEVALLDLVDQYRSDNGLSKVLRSKSLTTVAQWHIVDAVANEDTIFDDPCNLHSWSNSQPGLWSAVCYTADHKQASGMWSKPREITGGLYSGNGYEISGWGYISVEAMLAGWQRSYAHNSVILNQGIWANHPFKAMGVGVDLESKYFFVWFGEAADSQGEVYPCDNEALADDALFVSDFE